MLPVLLAVSAVDPDSPLLQHPARAASTSGRSNVSTSSTATSTSTKQQASSRVVPDVFWSQSLGVRKRYLVWLPPSYESQPDRRYPVAYYLHGAFGGETDWTRQGQLAATLDSLVAAGVPEMIVVMPDGDDGFYTTWNSLADHAACRGLAPPGRRDTESVDTYCVPWPHYDDYIARDLVTRVDQTWRTLPDRRHRGIAGLSTGGYGAVSLALAYPDVFSAAASHSGLLSPERGTNRRVVRADSFSIEALREAYGPALWALHAAPFGRDSASWAARSPARLASRLVLRQPALFPALRVDCGLEDFLLVQNRAFRDDMRTLGVSLEYREHAGGHTWDYWRRHSAHSAAWLATRLSVP